MALRLTDSTYADKVVAGGGQARRDIRAYAVLELNDPTGEHLHVVLYPQDHDNVPFILAGCRNLVVRWASQEFRRDYPDLATAAR